MRDNSVSNIEASGNGVFSKWRGFVTGMVTLTLLCLLSSGCAVFKPYVTEPPFQSISQNGKNVTPDPSTMTYEDALNQSTLLKSEIANKRQSLHGYQFWSGAALVGAGIASAGLTAYGANKDILIGAALGVGTIVGARTYVPIASRQKIYSKALEAINGAVNGTTLIKTNDNPNILNTTPFNITTTDQSVSGMEAVLNNTLLRVGKQVSKAEFLAAQFNTNRTILLINALKDIALTANSALSDEILDPSAALTAATNQIGAARANVANTKSKAQIMLDNFQSNFEVSKMFIDYQANVAAQAALAANPANPPAMAIKTVNDFNDLEHRADEFSSRLDLIGIEP